MKDRSHTVAGSSELNGSRQILHESSSSASMEEDDDSFKTDNGFNEKDKMGVKSAMSESQGS